MSRWIKTYKALAVVLLVTSSNSVFANWNPEVIFYDEDYWALGDSEFVRLKENVVSDLRGSWCSEEKMNLLMDLVLIEQPKVSVEIGVFTGSSLLPVATTLAFLGQGSIYAIDAWSNEEAVRYWDDQDPNKAWWAALDMNQVFGLFEERLDQWGLHSYCNVIRCPSEWAVDLVPEIDFLHLDGDYSEKQSWLDVELYLPKVKSGGYILLSNLLVAVNGEFPKMKTFYWLFDSCEMICEIEQGNAILFRKS